MGPYVLDLLDIDRTRVADVGAKGANLGELLRLDDVLVPPGFCITTDAFRRVLEESPSVREPIERLAALDGEDRDAIQSACGAIRRVLEGSPVPPDVRDAVVGGLAACGTGGAYAVRSSATAEDLPDASFAGQLDSFLDVVGVDSVLAHVRRCWASLFTERAATYRIRNGIDVRQVGLAVVVQRMVAPQAAGVLFTADPTTSDRTVCAVEAVRGKGEDLVSGRAAPDRFRVRDSRIVGREPAVPGRPVLPDERILELARIGRRIEAHFGRPQDIEWCFADGTFTIVQSRPVTTLFPIPEPAGEGRRVYVSVGHQQMMTDAMKPLGLSLFLTTTRAPMRPAGGRLFVDVTAILASPVSRKAFFRVIGRSDPLIRDALRTLVRRKGFLPAPQPTVPGASARPAPAPAVAGGAPAPLLDDPSVVPDLIRANEESVAALERALRTTTGTDLLDVLQEDLRVLQGLLNDPRSSAAIHGAMQAAAWIDDRMERWLGERNAVDALSQSLPHDVTSAMGLALLDVADAVRPHPEVAAYLRDARDDGFLEGLAGLEGGEEVRRLLSDFLDRYGMRCAGEIDVTRPRWRETPTAIVPAVLGNVRNAEPGAAARILEQGRREAERKERALLERVAALPGGAAKARAARRRIAAVRTLAGYREYPKYGMMRRYFLYKQALLAEAGRLVASGVLAEPEDLFFLTLPEIREAVGSQRVEPGLVARRREEFRIFRRLSPPRVLTSDGECVAGSYRRGRLPEGALPGLAVSSGIAEGRARVVASLAEADLQEGDILVTRFTDPGWTPLFATIRGLVAEVGGRMTHGSVIAREYGLPAVVGVVDATRRIRDGQRIRVDGTAGTVEILSRP